MPLSRQELIDLSERYFEGCNIHNHEQVMNTFTEDCLMAFSAADFRYTGKAALSTHFEDFLGTFKVIDFHDFVHIADQESQSICTYFTVALEPHEGENLRMRNCNIFHLNDQGVFKDCLIYNSGVLDQGFHAGNDS